MFKRRIPKSVTIKAKNLLWPCMGWSRLMSYYQHRVGRMRGTPQMIAAGFASGVAVSFTPLMGFHFILGIIIAIIVRGSIVASLLGTLFGNPWTFPVIWLLIYKLGQYILSGDTTGAEAMNGLHFNDVWAKFFPMMIGSIPCAIIAWVLTYYIMRDIVARYQTRRKRRIARKAQKRKEKMLKDFKDSAE